MTLVVPRARVFAPPRLAGCIAWLRADRGLPSGIADGGTIALWNSLVAGGANAIQNTGANKPIWHASGGLNNRPYLSFDGVRAFDWSSLNLNSTMTFFEVFKATTSPGVGQFYSHYTIKHTTVPTFSELIHSNIGGAYLTITFRNDGTGASNGVGYNATIGTIVGHSIIVTYNGGTNTATASYTSVFDAASQTIANSSVFSRGPTDISSIGGRITSAGVVSFGMVGELYDVAVYNRVLSSAEQIHLTNYAKNRYKL